MYFVQYLFIRFEVIVYALKFGFINQNDRVLNKIHAWTYFPHHVFKSQTCTSSNVDAVHVHI